MLTLVTIATFLLDLCSSSPVYNMQPAFITANIGATTGRNIRNLPCISRKNNQSGVCMFAIDCLKSNGTHLGTCIDRFYFGSCCHIEPVHDIIENTIDTDIIPHREPPFRISSTTSSSLSTVQSTVRPSSVQSNVFEIINKLNNVSDSTTVKLETTTQKLSTSTSKVVTTQSTTTKPKVNLTTTSPSVTEKLQTFQSINVPETTTKLPTTTTSKLVTKAPTKVTTTTQRPITNKPNITTSGSVGKPITRPAPKPSRPLENTQKPITTGKPKKPITTTTSKPSRVTTRPVTTTPKPSRPITTITTTGKPVKTTKPTQKPVKPSTKPTKTSTAGVTRKPVTQRPTTIITTTKRPAVTKSTTKRPTITTKPTRRVTTTLPPTTTQLPTKPRTTTTTTTTAKPTTKPQRITTQSPIVLTTQPSKVQSTTVQSSTAQPVTKQPPTTETNDVPITKLNISSILETVNGNPATNEIEAAKPVVVSSTEKTTNKPSLVTWTVADDRRNVSTTVSAVVNGTDSNITDPESWVPITTPDGWVLLPSVSPGTTSPTIMETTQAPITTPLVNSTISSSTTAKPFITYIPLQTSTSTEVPLVTAFSTSSPASPTTSEKTADPTITTERPAEVTSTSTTSSSFTDNLLGTTSSPDIKPVNMSDFTDVCGRRMYPEARIVGGEKSPFGKWPWQISLRQWRTSTYLHKCGAALLNENWAITAAHCVDNVPPSDLLLRLGEHDLSTESEPYLHQERRVQIVASHPQFDPRTFEYDLALLRFYEPVTFQPNILPVCVPQTDENFVGRTAYVTGWGRLYEDGPLPSVLQEVSVPVINNSVCESMYRSAGYIEHIPHIFICAGWRRGGFDSCEGDSGGPMVIQREDKRFLLAGVISWGIGCAEPNQPGVYTRISEFRDWINQILQF